MGLFHVQESSILILVPSETDLFKNLSHLSRVPETPFDQDVGFKNWVLHVLIWFLTGSPVKLQ